MSLFKKPKKNIRRRAVGISEEEENGSEIGEKGTNPDDDDEDIAQLQSNIAKLKEKKKERRKHAPLSFEEDLNEGDGEIFQVRKTPQSKKITKILDKERKKKKDDKGDQTDVDPVISKTSVKKEDAFRVLNGREAEQSSEGIAEDDDKGKQTPYANTDHFKRVLESGCIPDAAMIHAARKRRQMAREMGGDFIPLDESKRSESGKSRLVREEDENEASDEEERIDFTVNTTARDKEKRREAFFAAQDEGSGVDSDKADEELENWESQQIRKGVTGAQLAAAQQEVLYQQYIDASGFSMTPSEIPQSTPIPVVQEPQLQYPAKSEIVTPESIVYKFKERLNTLNEVHRRHILDRDKVQDDLVTTHSDNKKCETGGPALAKRFKFYQELRGYVTDLVECLDEKVPLIDQLEVRMHSTIKQKSEQLIERRRQDIKDQSEELSSLSRLGAPSLTKRSHEEEEARVRRAAEREGRRTRRRRARELKGANVHHYEGMSSDDEQTELEVTAFKKQKDQIDQDAKHVFEDVVDEFCTMRGVMDRFESWKENDFDSYKEAYVSLCLPKIFNPIIRLKLLSWNPVEEYTEFEHRKWYDCLLLYGLQDTETEESLRQDPDLKLVSLVIEKVIIPKLTQLVEMCWDPVSTSQTLRLVGLIGRMLQEYPTLGSSSRALYQLLTVVVHRMRDAVENDVFIPLYPKQVLDSKGTVLGLFFQRQFWSTVKLLRNLLSWQGVVGDELLQELALVGLLNRYLLAALRNCDPADAIDKCRMIVSTFPRWWFQNDGNLVQLDMFVNYLVALGLSIESSTPVGRELVENVVKLLKTIGAKGKSEELAKKCA